MAIIVLALLYSASFHDVSFIVAFFKIFTILHIWECLSFIEYYYHLTYLGEEKEKILGRARFDEEEDIWKLGPTRPTSGPLGKRPVSAAGARRPVSEYARCVCVCNMMYVCKSVNE